MDCCYSCAHPVNILATLLSKHQKDQSSLPDSQAETRVMPFELPEGCRLVFHINCATFPRRSSLSASARLTVTELS